MEVRVIDGIGHVLVPELVGMVADWVWRWAVVDGDAGQGNSDKSKI
jgi:hypothetical protein